MIAFNINKTGYAKIAQLVDMPEDCDIPQLVKYPSLSSTTKDEEDDEDPDELNVTTNP